MRRKLNLHRRKPPLQPLCNLEMETMITRGTTVGASQTDQERRHSKLFRVFQWKYKPDTCKPWWKRLYFHWIFLPFARFSYFRMDVVPFERLEPDGSLSWKEDEGYFFDEWRAVQEASKYPFGGYNEVAVESVEGSESCKPRCQFPQSRARGAYVKHGKRQVEVELGPVESLQRVLQETQHIVDDKRYVHR